MSDGSSGGVGGGLQALLGRLRSDQRLFAGSMGLVLLFLLVGGTTYLDLLARRGLQDEAVRISAVVARGVTGDVALRDVDGMREVLDATRVIPEVDYAVVRQPTGEVIAGRDSRRYVRSDLVVGDHPRMVRGDGLLHVVVPIPGPDGAGLQLGYRTDALRTQRLANIALMLAMSALLGAAGLALGRLMARGARETGSGGGAVSPADEAIVGLYDHDFLAYISHELRTPLTAIIGYGEMLEEDAVFLEQNDFVPDLKKIRKAGEHLLALVDDIVDLIRLRSGQLALTVRTFDVSRLVEEVRRDVAPLLDRTLSTLHTDVEDNVESMMANRQLVRRSLTNMIRFVCGLTAQGELELGVSKRIEDQRRWVVFRLSHPGLYLDPAKIDALLNDFATASTRQLPQYHGSGLGFVITRGFCQRMGGRFEISSSAEEGTTLTMQLPVYVEVL